MPYSLQNIIEQLKTTPVISARSELKTFLIGISKYSDDENDRAYMLGLLFKKKINSENIPPELKARLISYIKNKKLENFYYLKTSSGIDQDNILELILLIGGLVVIIVGLFQLLNGMFSVKLNFKYLAFVVQDGGCKIILGLVFFLGGYSRYRYERRKQIFIKQLMLQNQDRFTATQKLNY